MLQKARLLLSLMRFIGKKEEVNEQQFALRFSIILHSIHHSYTELSHTHGKSFTSLTLINHTIFIWLFSFSFFHFNNSLVSLKQTNQTKINTNVRTYQLRTTLISRSIIQINTTKYEQQHLLMENSQKLSDELFTDEKCTVEIYFLLR